MRDQSLSIAEAAAWLKCSEAEVEELVQAGRLRADRMEPAIDRISLNTVIVLAESLPVERRIFEVREAAGRIESSESRGHYPSRPSGGMDQRPPVVVERRPSRSFTPR
ncbi:hypothetical protein TSH58p_19110 (plasmid) [Azospirillum sp. TSH58]|uniref:Uncharacterized protein n=1 Tax=Azospirillum brasilense TaxID=192 RepID=A0A4D8RIE3_AZOBR|nr:MULTISPECIES: hypothetical protein [Azospirillum]AWJ85672.1 hypothetical protein TSH58p_19110 [Azospirillum sp. TSH58]PWC61499.1 hypothetical protein TSH58_26840 [Azospirillum sp. TSH58]QCO19159.1 hypothetical protein D3869_28415 [Azospirillum brasilense]